MELKFDKWAVRWGEALPIGNGHIGGMVYGNPCKDKVDLSEITFFSGERSQHNNQKGADKAFYRMREQIQKGDYVGALQTSQGFMGMRHNYGTNLPVGSLSIDYGYKEGEVKAYTRCLDMEKGMVRTSYECEGNKIETEVFASHPDKVMVYHIKSSFKGLGAKISLENYSEGHISYTSEEIGFTSYAYEKMHSDGKSGTILKGRAFVKTDGETAVDDGIVIKESSYIVIYLGMLTDFDEEEGLDILERRLSRHIGALDQKDLGLIRERQTEDVGRLMNRVAFHVEGIEEDKYIGIIPIMFQYGRYLLLSSSREDSKLPTHLQGIWNDNVACRIGWTCDMHLDINTQMNYWPAEITNLQETTAPLFRWIEKSVVPSGRITARESYGLKGWIAELVSNAWGFTAPYWASPIAPCPTGGVWILTHMWEHYLYKKDKAFLKEYAYPVIREAAEFFVDYVFEDEKTCYLLSGPSISPENSFLKEDKVYQMDNGATYEILMIRELFEILVKACKELGIEDELAERAAKALPRLLPYRITEDGSIAEWQHDYPAADEQHRHTSHLLGIFPFAQITPQKTPELAEAVKATIEKKLTPIDKWEDTGWARSMLLLYAARLQDSEKAYGHIKSMLEGLLESNYFIIHPPTRGAQSFDNVYELDGNTGLTSGIAEMLLQSHDDALQLLPALPKSWSKGYIKGLKARGGIEVDMTWENGQLDTAVLKAEKASECVVYYKNIKKTLQLSTGIPQCINFN